MDQAGVERYRATAVHPVGRTRGGWPGGGGRSRQGELRCRTDQLGSGPEDQDHQVSQIDLQPRPQGGQGFR